MPSEVPISATDIIPRLYDDFDDGREESHEDKVDDLLYDVYNLVSCDYHALKLTDTSDISSLISDAATRASQLLVKRLFECPIEPSVAGPLALLPAPVFRLPREKRIPEPKAETKWEKFAREKNIKKKKKERMVYDEKTGEYKPRWGYKGINSGIEDHAIVEVKEGRDPYADPWAEERKEKKTQVLKNLKKEAKNRARDKTGKIDKSKLYDPKSKPGIPINLENREGKRGKQGVKTALQLVQHSTASMGRFDEMRKGEPERKLKGKKRSFRDNISDSTLTKEKDVMKAQLRIVTDKIDKKKKGVTNSLSAYEGILPDAPSNSFKQKKGKGRARPSSEDGGQKKKKAKLR